MIDHWLPPLLLGVVGIVIIALVFKFHGHPYKRIAGDAVEWLLRFACRRLVGVHQGFLSYRIAYQAHVDFPVPMFPAGQDPGYYRKNRSAP